MKSGYMMTIYCKNYTFFFFKILYLYQKHETLTLSECVPFNLYHMGIGYLNAQNIRVSAGI
jgi:hypothetical protein